jgi:hypothetical protein
MAMPTRASTLTLNGLSKRLRAPGFTRHAPGVDGFDIQMRRDGGAEIWHRAADGSVRRPGPLMGEWGQRLAAAGFTVAVAGGTHLVVTLSAGGAAASQAVERAA